MVPHDLRVAVDATPLLGPRTGVGSVTAAILRGLGQRTDLSVTAFPVTVAGRARLRHEVPPGVGVVAPALPARALRRWWQRSSWPPIDWAIGRHDVVHGPNFVVPPSRAARIATVHDLTALRFPELCEPDTRRYPHLIRRAAAEGAWIHTVSHAVRDEVVAELGLAPDRVVAIPNGFDPVGGDPRRGRRLAGRDAYVLSVGTVEPRKDLPALLRAVDRLPAELGVTLVHAGGDGWGVGALDRTAAAMRHPERFRRLGRVEPDALAALYAGAHVVAYPSVYEGFGLPVLEAMSAGVPVVTTDVPALREVTGGAALHCAVGDVDGLADALTRAWQDEAWRAEVVARGRLRCERYSWDRCVAELVALYHRAAGSG